MYRYICMNRDIILFVVFFTFLGAVILCIFQTDIPVQLWKKIMVAIVQVVQGKRENIVLCNVEA